MKYIIITILTIFVTTSFAAVKTINPTQTNAQWHSTLNNLEPGDTVYLEDGVYTNFQVDIRGTGTATNPILVQARNYGKVFIEGEIGVRVGGNFITVDGLHFRNGWVTRSGNYSRCIFQFRIGTGNPASNSRLTNCVFDSLFDHRLDHNIRANDSWWVGLYHGSNNRVDNNYFGYKLDYGVLMFVDPRNGSQNVQGNHIVERNFFGHRPAKPENGVETIRIGDSDRSMWSVGCTIRENIFFRTDGEVEIISIKSCDNLIEGNLFFEAAGQVTCRHGHRNTIRNNVFIGNNKNQTSGVRIINSDQKIYNNWFQDLRGTGSRSALSVMNGLDPSCPLNSYYQVKNAEISYNTFINCQRIEFGSNTSTSGYTCSQNQGVRFPIVDSRFRNNLIFNLTWGQAFDTVRTNDVPVATAGITFEGNIYRIHPTAPFAREGFSLRPALNFEKPTGALFYELVAGGPMSCIPVLDGKGGFSEIETLPDVTGNSRQRPYTSGAINAENFGIPPKIPRLDQVGVSWYNYAKPNLNP